MESALADEWLTVSLERNGGLLLEHGLFKTLLNQLSPLDKSPSLISVFGASCNAPLVNALEGGMPHEPGPGIFVKLDTNTLSSEVPRLYANCFLDHCLLPADERIRSDCRRHSLSWYWNHVQAEEVVDRVYSNLVISFSDVLCFLATSLSSPTRLPMPENISGGLTTSSPGPEQSSFSRTYSTAQATTSVQERNGSGIPLVPN